MKTNRIFLASLLALVLSSWFLLSCENNSDIDKDKDILPEHFRVDIPSSISNPATNGRLAGRSKTDSLQGNDIYQNLNLFVAVGEGASKLVEEFINGIRKYKTDPAAYALGPQALGLPARDILFVSSNGWDAIGATWYGYTTLWVNRAGLPIEQLDTAPSRIGSSLRDVLDFFPTP